MFSLNNEIFKKIFTNCPNCLETAPDTGKMREWIFGIGIIRWRIDDGANEIDSVLHVLQKRAYGIPKIRRRSSGLEGGLLSLCLKYTPGSPNERHL